MIGIDAGNWLDRPPTGVAVYARNLIWELARQRPDQHFRWFLRGNRYFRSLGERFPPNARRSLNEAPLLGLSTRRLTLFHGLNQRLPEGIRAPRVATFHDLFALTGEYSTLEFRRRFARLARETAGLADHIIAVSAHTAEQVAERIGYPRSQITVVHHGAEPLRIPSQPRCEAILADLGIKRPFILHVGTLQVRKNIERVVEAFEATGGNNRLVLAGSSGFGADRIEARIDRSALRDRIHLTGHVSDDALACLYASAEVLLFPSLEEGFGLPVVEAFSAGLPVITSNSSALAEVAGDAAELVDPLNSDEIAGALTRLLGNESLRAELRRKGNARAPRFTWERCAAKTWQVYQAMTSP